MAANNVDFAAIAKEIVRYGDKNPLALERAILSNDVYINRFAKPLAKVKGKWSVPSLFASHVVQIFHNEWNPYGSLKATLAELENFHQKVNFPFYPYEVYGSWLEHLYAEDLKPADMPISKYVVEKLLLPKIIDDTNILSVKGVFDINEKNKSNPRFGSSMNGLDVIVDNIVTTHPYFCIPVDAGDNIVDQVTEFEKQLPKGITIDGIILSAQDFDDYVSLRETPTDQFVNLNDPMRARTKYQRPIYSVPGLTSGRIIAWVSGTFFRLYDRKDNPAKIDDVQTLDYMIKIFSQWHLGYGFGASELLFVSSVAGGASRGLGDDEANKLVYPAEFTNKGGVPGPSPISQTSVTVNPATVAISGGDSVQFEAVVFPLAANQKVKWSATGGSGDYAIDENTGLFTTGLTADGSITVTATTVQDEIVGTATVTATSTTTTTTSTES